jgi:hypothetical protein
MAREESMKFMQITVAADGLYGLTASGDVWKFDADAGLWKPLPMVSEPARAVAAR